MKITLLIFLALSGIFAQDPIQDQSPELPNYSSYPYFSRNENENKHDLIIKFRPRCNKDWGPTVASLYDKESTSSSSEVIAIFFNEDEKSPRSAEWEVSVKTDEKWSTVVRCYLYEGGKFVFKGNLQRKPA